MSVEAVLSLILGSGIISSALVWWTTRHKPRTDQAQVVISGSHSLIDQLQEERERLDKRIDAVEKRAVEAETRAAEAEHRAAEAERNAGYLAADMASITDHHLATVRGFVAGTVPPWLPVPRGQNWLTDDDYPPVTVTERHFDTGVPGVDLNPPPTEERP